MRADLTCDKVGMNLTAYREGSLSDRDRENVRVHLSDCDSCSADLARDDMLAATIAAEKDEHVDVPSFDAILEQSGRRATYRLVPRVAFAGGLAALSLAGLIVWNGLAPSRSASHQAVTTLQDASPPNQAFNDAHLMLSSSDFGSDPNRAVVLAHLDGHAERATP